MTVSVSSLAINGGFERPLVDDLAQRFEAGDASIPGWEIASGAVQIVNHTRLFPHEGYQCLLLECETNQRPVITQSFEGPIGVSIHFAIGASRAQRAVLDVLFNGHCSALPVTDLWKPQELAFTHDMKWRQVHLTMIGPNEGRHRLQLRVREFEPIDDRQEDPRHRVQGILIDALTVKPLAP
jgi:hypothetical protein